MGTRGRHSNAELTVVTDKTIETVKRPEPPEVLSSDEGEVWIGVVNRLPPDWFTKENYPLLTQYCRHVIQSNMLAVLIEEEHEKITENSGAFEVDEYDKLLRMQEREGRAISSLATRMRLTQHSTYDAKKKKPPVSGKPWEN